MEIREGDVLYEVQSRLTTPIAWLYPTQGEWSERDYFALPDTNWIVELSEGYIFMSPPPSDTHQRLLDNLYAEMRAFVKRHRLGVLRFAPLAVRLWPGKIREPDILFVSNAHADRVGEPVYGPPDLVVEVISPGSAYLDREEKFYEYARAGVAEYWLVDPQGETVEVLVLQDDVYVLLVKAGRGEKAYSQVLDGFEILADEVFA